MKDILQKGRSKYGGVQDCKYDHVIVNYLKNQQINTVNKIKKKIFYIKSKISEAQKTFKIYLKNIFKKIYLKKE